MPPLVNTKRTHYNHFKFCTGIFALRNNKKCKSINLIVGLVYSDNLCYNRSNGADFVMTKEKFIEVITKCQTGDKNSICQIYDEYFGRMCITAFGIVNDSDVAYDIASNVILKLLELRHGISDIENLVGYMFRIKAMKVLQKL